MAKYNKYIELRPGYESVVDLHSEERNADLWKEYIVHEDMKEAIDKICSSFKMEIPDQRRSFWIHGTYGTGKSYAAIVLKHLFTDTVQNVKDFFDRKKLLTPYKNQFLSLRDKGEYLVVWKSGVTGIKSGVNLMMEMEISIRNALREKFGDEAYYGKTSLVSEAQRIVSDKKYNWETIFEESDFLRKSYYDDFEDFRQDVMEGDVKACSLAGDICRENGWALFASVDSFEDWVADILEGNRLKDTGIVFIWDEFTDFVRENGDDNVLQRLSEYCKKSPLYLFLIVHVDTSWVTTLGEDTYQRIMHRYHELQFNITETAALEMVAESIECRNGMNDLWDSIRKPLVKDIIDQFDEMSIYKLTQTQMEDLFPIHPMTLTMLTRVADNFAAASRTLFSFLKDEKKAGKGLGFIAYINNNGPDDWRWLTVDYLWDYFFAAGSDIRNFSTEAKRAYQLYEQKKDLVTGDGSDYVLRVFKACLLMIAVMSSDKVMFGSNRRIIQKADATRNTIRKCFAGQLSENVVDDCLQSLYDSGIFYPAVTSDKKDVRIELPYGQNVDKFDSRLVQIQKRDTRYKLFSKGGLFSKYVEDQMWSKSDAIYNRLVTAVCTEETASINTRYEEVKKEVEKFSYKLGSVTVVLTDSSHLAAVEQRIKGCQGTDRTNRIGFSVLKTPLTDEIMEDWYRASTHYELANEDGKEGSASKYEEERRQLLGEWAGVAIDGPIVLYCGEKTYQSVYGKDDLKKRIKKELLLKNFEAAPEQIVELATVYKKAQETFAFAGVTLNNGQGLKVNAQMTQIADVLKNANIWDCSTIEELEVATGSPIANAVAKLANYIHGQMTQGAKIQLDTMWSDLQKPPFGYYNNMVCAYLLGFVFRFWKDSEFNWIDNESNTFLLTDKYLAKMVLTMCSDNANNHTLASGSEIWHSFKDYLKSIFDFQDDEIPNEQKARHSLAAKIVNYGVPLWALKYISEDKFGSAAAKAASDIAIDGFVAFVQNRPETDQEDVMSSVVQAFKGNGRARKHLKDVMNNSNDRYSAFRLFIQTKNSDMKKLMESLCLNNNDLFDSLKKLMQANIETWTENEVEEKLDSLAEEYQMVLALNYAIGRKEKTLQKHIFDLNNCFSSMKVPGTVIESMGYEWCDALKTMYLITKTSWQKLTVDEKQSAIYSVRKHGVDAWQNITGQKVLLGEYIKRQGIECTDDELTDIFNQITEWDYSVTIPAFREHINGHLENLLNEKRKVDLLVQWRRISGFDTVEEWCRSYNVPVQWVVKSPADTHIECINKINNHKPVVSHDVNDALNYLKTANLSCLSDAVFIKNQFFAEIGTEYRECFSKYGNDLYARIRVECGSVVYDWGKKSGRIIQIVQAFNKAMCERQLKQKTIEKVKNANIQDLRESVICLLNEHPELCEFFNC